jgi:hypothetical protein
MNMVYEEKMIVYEKEVTESNPKQDPPFGLSRRSKYVKFRFFIFIFSFMYLVRLHHYQHIEHTMNIVMMIHMQFWESLNKK